MAYSLAEIKIAAYNYEELENMSQEERHLWMGLAWCYECFRAGEDKALCDALAQNYIKLFYKGGKTE